MDSVAPSLSELLPHTVGNCGRHLPHPFSMHTGARTDTKFLFATFMVAFPESLDVRHLASWLLYALGSQIPGSAGLYGSDRSRKAMPVDGVNNWSNGFMPAAVSGNGPASEVNLEF